MVRQKEVRYNRLWLYLISVNEISQKYTQYSVCKIITQKSAEILLHFANVHQGRIVLVLDFQKLAGPDPRDHSFIQIDSEIVNSRLRYGFRISSSSGFRLQFGPFLIAGGRVAGWVAAKNKNNKNYQDKPIKYTRFQQTVNSQ